MRPLIEVFGLSKAYGFHDVFKDIGFQIVEGETAALVGPNGVGKSTLLKILAGKEEATEGTVRFFHPTSIAYVPQDPEFPPQSVVREIVEREVTRLGEGCQASLGEALSRFGFGDKEASLAVCQLSGGQKTRLALTQAWLAGPEVLLLDEPTNHLDEDGLKWLAGFVQEYSGTVVVVSHDRFFLDQVADRILEMTPDRVREYRGNYTKYREAKEEAFRNQLEQWEDEQKRIRKIEEAIERQMQWFEKSHREAGKDSDVRKGTKEFYRARAKRLARRAKSNIKRLESMKESAVDKPKREQGISFDGFSEETTGRRVIVAKGLGKSFARPLFAEASFAVLRGDKVGVVGPNGVGKTTLFRMILGEEAPTAGSLWVSPGAKVGYLDQELGRLNAQNSLVDEVVGVFATSSPEVLTKVRTMLACFLFSETDLRKPISVLSTGERKRVALVKLLLSDYNVLLLDEPTDHLDLPARERLEEALVEYQGTALVISHDRYLLNRVCTKIAAIEDGKINFYHGTFAEYAEGKDLPRDAEESISPGERLLLETRLAVIGSKLNTLSRDEPQYREMETEYITISRKLNAKN